MSEPSSDWAYRQRDFCRRFGAERDGLTPAPVHWRATPATTVAVRDGFNAILADGLLSSAAQSIARLRKRAPTVVRVPFLTVWPAGATVAFTFEIAEPPSLAYEGDGQLYGELAPNGTPVVVTDDGELIWATSSPRPGADQPTPR